YKPPGPSEEDQKLMALYDTGRVLVATVLNVETNLITPDVLESHMGKLSLDKTLKPLSQEELKNRLIVLMAGPAVEKKYNHEQISVGSSGSLDTASQVAAMMVLKLGMGDNFGRYVPKELYGDAEKLKAEEEIRTLFVGAEKRAREIIDQYAHRLEPLKEALTTLKVLSRDEVLLILEGKNLADIKKERGLFFRLKQSMGGAKKTHAKGNTTTTINQKVDLNQVSSAPAQGQMSAAPLLPTKEAKVSS
ncbi:MAG: hypothetical protein K2X66_01765, partial [Cyanobacteria bacterium]|nr:hypothetical protein [Cyanobacteriota bacterium]